MANSGQTETAPSAKQLVFLAMVATVVAVIVFLCGVLVGRGVPARRSTGMTGAEAVPDNAGAVGIGVPDIAPDPDAASGTPLDALSYFELLNSAEPALETLQEPGVAPSQTTLVEEGTPAAAPVALLPEPNGVTATPMFVLQVTALQDGDEARTVAASLEAGGYPAFVVAPSPGTGGAVYRVRVGPYADPSEAETVRRRLETEEQFRPWVIQQQ
jgi:cell division septation protein DedD